MSGKETGDTKQPLRTRIACKIYGHDTHETGDEIVCRRCGHREPDTREEQHDDPDAEPGDTRYSVEKTDRGVEVTREKYQATAWGPESKYFQWWGSTRLTINEEELEEVHEKLGRFVDAGTKRGDQS